MGVGSSTARALVACTMILTGSMVASGAVSSGAVGSGVVSSGRAGSGPGAPPESVTASALDGITFSEGTRDEGATESARHARAVAAPLAAPVRAASVAPAVARPAVVRAVTGSLKSINLTQCLRYTWRIRAGFACLESTAGRFTTYVDGSRVWLNYTSGWRLSPYRYTAATNSARIDPDLIPRPALKTGTGSSAWVPLGGSVSYWNPCRTSITWRVDFTALEAAWRRSGLAPDVVAAKSADELDRLTSVFGTLHAIGGWDFTYLGRGTYRTGGSTTPASFGSGSNPDLIITFGTPGDPIGYGTDMNSSTVGKAGSRFVSSNVQGGGTAMQILDGFATFDYRYVMIANRSIFKAKGVDSVRALYMHELGHAVGLGHVSDPLLIMNPQADPRVDDRYGAGDLAGLVALGRKACFVP